MSSTNNNLCVFRKETLEKLTAGGKIAVNEDDDVAIEELHDKWIQVKINKLFIMVYIF